MADAGYVVARYVSLEQLVADSSDDYYASLLASTHGWHEAEHDPWPWLEYLTHQTASAYALSPSAPHQERAEAGSAIA